SVHSGAVRDPRAATTCRGLVDLVVDREIAGRTAVAAWCGGLARDRWEVAADHGEPGSRGDETLHGRMSTRTSASAVARCGCTTASTRTACDAPRPDSPQGSSAA